MMRQLLRRWAYGVIVAGAMCVTGPRPASAQMVVSDPTNLVQNTATALAQVDEVVNQIIEIRNQIQQIEMMAKDLERLSVRDWQSLRSSYYRLDASYRRAKYISMRWGQIASQYDAHYEAFDPEVHDGEDYQHKREKWAQQTDDAVRTAMVSHGVVDAYGDRSASLDRLVEASNASQGTLAALQAGNQISAMILRQLMELSELIVADSRARLSHIKEQQMAGAASRKQGDHSLMRGYGEKDVQGPRPPSALPKVK